MKPVLFFSFFFFIVVCQSCNTNNSSKPNHSEETDNKVSVLKEEVMAAHDRVMPYMSPMGRKQNQLREMAQNSPDSTVFIEVAIDLKKAQNGMMEWMRSFKAPEEQGWSEEEKARYLREEKAKMIEIENLTFQTLYLADSLIESNTAAQPD